jgi:hypothetical protein
MRWARDPLRQRDRADRGGTPVERRCPRGADPSRADELEPAAPRPSSAVSARSRARTPARRWWRGSEGGSRPRPGAWCSGRGASRTPSGARPKDAPQVLLGAPNDGRLGEHRGCVGFPSPTGRFLVERLADSSADGRKMVKLTMLVGPPAKSQLRGVGYGAYEK